MQCSYNSCVALTAGAATLLLGVALVHHAEGTGEEASCRRSSGEGKSGAWQREPGWIITLTEAQHGP